jgi:hypothetical protein
MDDQQIELEARGVFALMDGMQLQWLLNPSLPVAQMFKDQLEPVLKRWTRGAKPVKKLLSPEKVATEEGTGAPVAHA